MAYNKKGYYIRAKQIQAITAAHYEPENHAKCKKMIWKKYIYPQYGMCYETYLKYQNTVPPEEPKSSYKQLSLF